VPQSDQSLTESDAASYLSRESSSNYHRTKARPVYTAGQLGWTRSIGKSNRPAVKASYSHLSQTQSTIICRADQNFSSATQLKIDYFADTEFATYLNLSNHVYLNLNPKTNGCKQNIRNHRFTLFANAYTINDAEFIPTDRLQNMSNPFQYSSSDKNQRNGLTSKVDSHFITKDDALDLELIPIVDVSSPDSNIGVKISSTKPGFQFYTGHFLSAPFSPFDGFCIEPQYIPNAINREQHCSPLTLPETPYRHTTVFEFRQGQS